MQRKGQHSATHISNMVKVYSNKAGGLPAGWIMVPNMRKNSGKTNGIVDKHYFSPTFQSFRSMAAVRRFLAQQNVGGGSPPIFNTPENSVVEAPIALPAIAPVIAPVNAPAIAPVIAPVNAPVNAFFAAQVNAAIEVPIDVPIEVPINAANVDNIHAILDEDSGSVVGFWEVDGSGQEIIIVVSSDGSDSDADASESDADADSSESDADADASSSESEIEL